MPHPLAMAGVGHHSGYKGDPWGRLQRTSEYIAMTTFGPDESADRVIAHIRKIHETFATLPVRPVSLHRPTECRGSGGP